MGDITGSNPATCFPTASAVACSWDPEVAKKMANAIANEADGTINFEISLNRALDKDITLFIYKIN